MPIVEMANEWVFERVGGRAKGRKKVKKANRNLPQLVFLQMEEEARVGWSHSKLPSLWLGWLPHFWDRFTPTYLGCQTLRAREGRGVNEGVSVERRLDRKEKDRPSPVRARKSLLARAYGRVYVHTHIHIALKRAKLSSCAKTTPACVWSRQAMIGTRLACEARENDARSHPKCFFSCMAGQ